MKALPQAIAGASFHKGIIAGKVERGDAGDDAERLAHRIEIDAGAGAVGIFALHQMRDAEREFDHFDAALDVALGVGDRLAVLAREDVGELIVVPGDEVEEFHQHAGAALRIDRAPSQLRLGRVLDRGADLGLGGERHMRAHRAVHRLEDFRRASRLAGDMLAADEMPILDHVSLPWRIRWLRLLCRRLLRTAMSEFAHRLCGNWLKFRRSYASNRRRMSTMRKIIARRGSNGRSEKPQSE